MSAPLKRASPSRDSITVLQTMSGKLATKRFIMTNGVPVRHDYNAGFLFAPYEPIFLDDIFELSDALSWLEREPNCLVIRGAPKDPAYTKAWVQRTGSHGTGNFETPSGGHNWILIDFDKIDVPAHLSLTADPVAVCEHLISLLPPPFHNATYHWQMSSSAGMTTDPSKVSMHIWVWLDRPIPDAVLKGWAKSVNADAGLKLIDDALFQDVQAHYTGAPMFEGVTDPFPTRSGLVEKARHTVDLVVAQKASTPKPRRAAGTSSIVNVRAGSGIDYHLSQIGDQPGGNGFHNAIVVAAASYVGTHGIEGTDAEAVFELIGNAVLSADASRHDAAYIEHMASREHVLPIIESAILKFGSQASARCKSKIHTDIQPHFDSVPMSAAEAQRILIEIAESGQ